MDLTDPTRAVTPTLDGPVLAVLARSGRPLTVGEIAEQATRGSEIGIRRAVSRLVAQGIVRATLAGRNTVHELNRDHVAAPVAEVLAGIRVELWRRFRELLESWEVLPTAAFVFGSAARGDGTVESDIDLLLVHPLLLGEPESKKASKTWLDRFGDAAASYAEASSAKGLLKPRPRPALWERQVDDLRGRAQAWTGNRLQVVDLSLYEWARQNSDKTELVTDVRRDGVELVRRSPFGALVASKGDVPR
jgi:hypothetical protein